MDTKTVKEMRDIYSRIVPGEDITNVKMKKNQWAKKVDDAIQSRIDVLTREVEAGCNEIDALMAPNRVDF